MKKEEIVNKTKEEIRDTIWSNVKMEEDNSEQLEKMVLTGWSLDEQRAYIKGLERAMEIIN